jgi:hypothetical protein
VFALLGLAAFFAWTLLSAAGRIGAGGAPPVVNPGGSTTPDTIGETVRVWHPGVAWNGTDSGAPEATPEAVSLAAVELSFAGVSQGMNSTQ